MDEKIELTQKAVRKSVGQETTVVNMLNDEMEMLILSLGYRKESDTAREILTELKPIIINYLEEYMENGSEEAPKYFESLCKKYGVGLGE